jgi:hypothetical protein
MSVLTLTTSQSEAVLKNQRMVSVLYTHVGGGGGRGSNQASLLSVSCEEREGGGGGWKGDPQVTLAQFLFCL